MHANPILPLDYTNVQDVTLGPIDAPSSNHVHPLYLDLFHEPTKLVVSANHSKLYPVVFWCNNVHGDDVPQS